MSQNTPQHKRRVGPQYYRVPAFWGLIATLIIVIVLMVMLFRLA